MTIETQGSVASLGSQLAELNGRAEALVQTHRELLGRRPGLALRDQQHDIHAKDQLDALDAELAGCDIDLRNIGDATREIRRQLDDQEQLERAAHDDQERRRLLGEHVQKLTDFYNAVCELGQVYSALDGLLASLHATAARLPAGITAVAHTAGALDRPKVADLVLTDSIGHTPVAIRAALSGADVPGYIAAEFVGGYKQPVYPTLYDMLEKLIETTTAELLAAQQALKGETK